jgi:hypothetical protein
MNYCNNHCQANPYILTEPWYINKWVLLLVSKKSTRLL